MIPNDQIIRNVGDGLEPETMIRFGCQLCDWKPFEIHIYPKVSVLKRYYYIWLARKEVKEHHKKTGHACGLTMNFIDHIIFSFSNSWNAYNPCRCSNCSKKRKKRPNES